MTSKGEPQIERLLGRGGRLKQMPVRPAAKQAVLRWLIAKFEPARDYSEREINDVLDAWHAFGDHTRLRRELCDAGMPSRTDDGARYWRPA
jgi:hypothetical protein